MRSGLSNQVGWAAEPSYGTPTTPNKFAPVTKASFKQAKPIVIGQALTAGDFQERGAQRKPTTVAGTGSIEMELLNRQMNQLFRALMGTAVTGVQQGGTAAYLWSHVLADPFGQSLTMQSGVPEAGTGTVRPKTLIGSKITDAEFTFAQDALAKVVFTIDAMLYSSSVALAGASYPSALQPFPAINTKIKVGSYGTEAQVDGVSTATCKISRPSNTGRYYLGNAGQKREPILNDKASVITGTISADYVDKTIWEDRFETDSSFSMIMECTGLVIAAPYFDTVRLTLPQCFLDGDTAEVDGPDVVNGDFPFYCMFDGTNQPKLEVIAAESTI